MHQGADILQEFCASRHVGDEAAVPGTLGDLDGFFEKGERGIYTLSPAHAVDLKGLECATADLCGEHVRSVELHPRTDVRVMDRKEDERPDFGKTVFETYDVDDFKAFVWRRYLTPLERSLGPMTYHLLSDAFMKALGEPIWHSFECEYWQDVGYDLKLAVRPGVLMLLLAFIGHSVTGHEEADPLRAFLPYLLQTVPYGLRRDARHTLVSIVD